MINNLSSWLALVLIFNSLIKYMRAYNHTKDHQGVIRIKNSKYGPLAYLALALIILIYNCWDINFSQLNLKELSKAISPALPWLLLTLSNYDYNFITSNGLIINGKKYDWCQITKWDYKKDFHYVLVFEIFPKKSKNEGGITYADTVELNISKDNAEEIESLLRQYLGARGRESYYFNSFN